MAQITLVDGWAKPNGTKTYHYFHLGVSVCHFCTFQPRNRPTVAEVTARQACQFCARIRLKETAP